MVCCLDGERVLCAVVFLGSSWREGGRVGWGGEGRGGGEEEQGREGGVWWGGEERRRGRKEIGGKGE